MADPEREQLMDAEGRAYDTWHALFVADDPLHVRAGDNYLTAKSLRMAYDRDHGGRTPGTRTATAPPKDDAPADLEMELQLAAFERLLSRETPMLGSHRAAFRAGWKMHSADAEQEVVALREQIRVLTAKMDYAAMGWDEVAKVVPVGTLRDAVTVLVTAGKFKPADRVHVTKVERTL